VDHGGFFCADFPGCVFLLCIWAGCAALRWANYLISLAGVAGLEPATPGFGVYRVPFRAAYQGVGHFLSVGSVSARDA
jgi:hypothetical protein